MYIAELLLWFAWSIFYGSMIIFIALLVMAPLMNKRVVAREERVLEAHFGKAYLEYKSRVPRCFAKVQG
jgi:protein-S-isoprenylcysteine O-methyltransferase Ste14